MLNRRQFTQSLAQLSTALMPAGLVGTASAQATQGPKPALDTANIIAGFPPGGTVDALARRVADKMRGLYASTVLVENKPGAGGQLGILALRDSLADGSALLLTPSSMLSIYPYTYPKLRYTLDDLAPVSLGATMEHGLAVGPGVPDSVKTLKDFLAWTHANPGRANYGSPGAGSMPHMLGVLLGMFAKADLRHIAYRGAAPGVQDLLDGKISAFWGPIGDFLQHQKTGKLRVLAISAPTRSVFLPQVPTLAEQGYPLKVREWYGFFLPGKATPDTVQRASDAVQAVLAQPDMLEFGKQYGLQIKPSSPTELARMLKSDADQWRRLIKIIGFTAEA